MDLSKTTQAAVKKYGQEDCFRAYRFHLQGWGARGMTQEQYFDKIKTTRQADAAINAGRELADAGY